MRCCLASVWLDVFTPLDTKGGGAPGLRTAQLFALPPHTRLPHHSDLTWRRAVAAALGGIDTPLMLWLHPCRAAQGFAIIIEPFDSRLPNIPDPVIQVGGREEAGRGGSFPFLPWAKSTSNLCQNII